MFKRLKNEEMKAHKIINMESGYLAKTKWDETRGLFMCIK